MKPEPYIPLRVSDLVEVLLHEAGTPEAAPLPMAEHEPFRDLAKSLHHFIELDYRAKFKGLADDYAPFDPDLETLRLGELGDDRRERLDHLFEKFAMLLQHGGFHRMTREEIEATIQGASYWGIEMDVAWDVFERVEIFVRGRGMGWRTRRPWWRLFRTQEVELPTFRRVVVILKQQPHQRLGPHADTINVFLKLFKNIPTMDVEMLLPGTRLRMPKLERGKLGGTALGSFLWLAWKLFPFITTGFLAGGYLVLITPLMLILGYGWKTFASFRVSKKSYMLQLTQSLYYQNLDSNAGVLHRLYEEACEQDTRQALLAYYFLRRFAPHGWTATELDTRIEGDLERRVGMKIEVDTDRALQRLMELGMVQTREDRFYVGRVSKMPEISSG